MAYLNVTEIESALRGLSEAYPDYCSIIELPYLTFEGRKSYALKIGRYEDNQRDGVLINGGLHAREWGSADIAVNFAADLLEAYTGGTGLAYGGKPYQASFVKAIVERLNLFIFPCANPDGRDYSQNSVPLWRPNRNTEVSGGDPNKVGVDLNRNFDFLWDFTARFAPSAEVRTSDDPGGGQDSTYHGPSAASEPEVRNVAWFFEMYPRIKWFMDLHSYSKLILFPWGDDQNQSIDPSMNFANAEYNSLRGIPDAKPDGTSYREYIPAGDLAMHQLIGDRINSAIAGVAGTSYTVQQSYSLYPTSGASDDYAYSRHMVDASKSKVGSFCIEWGSSFQPVWTDMEQIIREISSGLTEFCLVAQCKGGPIVAGGSMVQAVLNGAGELDVVTIGIDGKIYHTRQIISGGSKQWAPWDCAAGIENVTAMTALRAASGYCTVVAVDGNGNLQLAHHRSDTGWSGWTPLSNGATASGVAAVLNTSGALVLFYVATDSRFFRMWETAGEWSEERMGNNNYAKQLVAARNQDGRLEVFYIGTDDKNYHNWETAPGGSWYGERALGGKARKIIVGTNQDQRLEIFTIGMDDGIYHNWQTAPNKDWHGEKKLDGKATQLSVENNEDGRLEIFSVGMDGSIYHNWQTAPNKDWYGEKKLDTSENGPATRITAGRNQSGELEVFFIAGDGTIFHDWQKEPNKDWFGKVAL